MNTRDARNCACRSCYLVPECQNLTQRNLERGLREISRNSVGEPEYEPDMTCSACKRKDFINAAVTYLFIFSAVSLGFTGISSSSIGVIPVFISACVLIPTMIYGIFFVDNKPCEKTRQEQYEVWRKKKHKEVIKYNAILEKQLGIKDHFDELDKL